MKRANEVLVGATVLAALALLVAGSIWLSQMDFGGTRQIAEARFRTIGGLQTGNPVLLRGVKVGRVEDVSLAPNNWVNVRISISDDEEIPVRPAAIISSTTLFGDWGVDLVALSDSLDPEVRRQLNEAQVAGSERWPGATLPDIGELTAQAGRIAGDIASMASRFEDAFDSTSAVRLRGAFADLSTLSRRLSQIATRQQEQLAVIGENLDTGTAALARGAGALERTLLRADSATNREQLQRILSHADTVTDELRSVARNLRTVSGAAASQQESISRIIQNTDSVLARMEAGEGTLGRLSRDSTLYSESVQAVRSLREMLQDMQRNPRKYFSFSVF